MIIAAHRPKQHQTAMRHNKAKISQQQQQQQTNNNNNKLIAIIKQSSHKMSPQIMRMRQ